VNQLHYSGEPNLRGEDVSARSEELQGVLRRRVTIPPTASGHQLVNAFMTTLRAANTVGGIAYLSQASAGPEPICFQSGDTVRTVLSKIQALRPELVLDGAESVINLVDSRIIKLLETRIAHASIPNPSTDWYGAKAALLALPEVASQIRELRIEADGQFSNLAVQEPAGQTNAEPFILDNITLRQALNAIAQRVMWQRNGYAMWIYTERMSAQDDRVFSLELNFFTTARDSQHR